MEQNCLSWEDISYEEGRRVRLDEALNASLDELKNLGLSNEIDVLGSPNGPIVHINGRDVLNFSSNNYLGLATDPDLKRQAIEAIWQYGVGSGAVRTINGTLLLHVELEKALAALKGTEAAILFQSGFNANIATIPQIVDEGDIILSDELNHASIIDGCRLSRARVIRYRHSDMDDLREKAEVARRENPDARIVVITDGVFSMDGDIARLPEIVAIKKRYDLILYVDDAHGSGVLGKGRGTVKHFELSQEVDVQIGTLSKAIGVIGGYVAGSQALIDWLKLRARPFLFSTAPTPADTAAILAAVKKLQTADDLVETLWARARYFQEGLRSLGFNIGKTETPITPVIIGEEKTTQAFARALLEEGVYAKAIVYPTVSRGAARVRNMPTAAHTEAMIDEALAVYARVGRRFGLIA